MSESIPSKGSPGDDHPARLRFSLFSGQEAPVPVAGDQGRM